ncbi:hypothetical protein ACEPAI_7848 [Sanghuangporus weigelae]
MSSPIPIISVDDSACNPNYEYNCSPQYLSVASTPASTSSRRSSFHPSFIAGKLMPRRRMVIPLPPPPARPTRPVRPPPPPTTQQIRASVMRFLEQQEREMRVEVQRVGTEIRDLRRCVRAVKREQSQVQARSQFRNEAQTRVRVVPVEEFESGSGSDADTEEVSVMVIAAN